MTTKKDETAPTKRTVEQAIEELSSMAFHYGSDGWAEHSKIEKLDEQYEALQAKLLSNQRLKELKEEKDRLYAQVKLRKDELKQKIRKLRGRYRTHGMTPAVLKELQNLVEEYS